jgi:hypothetical protein
MNLAVVAYQQYDNRDINDRWLMFHDRVIVTLIYC